MQVNDDLYLGNGQAISLLPTSADNPTQQLGVGPAGRVFFLNLVPLTLATANIAALQAPAANTALVLAAIAASTTAGLAPDGSGRAVIQFDTPRAVSLTSAANLSAINFLVSGFDTYARPMTQLMVGPNANTVNSLKAFASVLSAVPSAASASTVSVGSSDVFGLPWKMTDASLLFRSGWANQVSDDAGTFVAADATSPATNLTGDTRGTYKPSTASNGARRLCIGMHLDGTQCGAASTLVNAIGVTPA